MFDLSTVFKGAGRLAVGGSRDLAGPGAVALVDLASCWQSLGRPVGVGCAVGADSCVLDGLVVPRLASVFAACSPSGSGAWAGTALGAVFAAQTRGAAVHWLSGGPVALALAARLAARSRALALASPAGCLVALSSRSSPGSLVLAGAVAARRGPVAALACNFPWYCLPPLGPAGHWRRLAKAGGVAAALWVAGQ